MLQGLPESTLPPVLIGASTAGLIFILARKQMQRSSNRYFAFGPFLVLGAFGAMLL